MPALPPGPVAILAGSGQLPALLADHCRRTGRPHRILAFRGFAEAAVRRRADAVVDLLDVKGALDRLEGWSPAAVTLAGAVTRPTPTAVLGAAAAVRNRHELAELFGGGDDHLLRGVINLLERRGLTVIGVHELAPELLSAPGVYGAVRPDPEQMEAVALGMRLLRDLSSYDMGQAAVVSKRRIVAVEGPEGTDRMLERVSRFGAGWFRRRPLPGGVLVKTAKAGQDLRVDLPAIGPRTFLALKRAGLQGAAIGAGTTLVLDRERTVATADRLGLFLVALAPGEGA